MDTYLGRKIKEMHEFKDESRDFGNYYRAEGWCRSNGYSVGSMCGDMPIAILLGEYRLPEKWRNMSNIEKSSCDGVMIGEFRNGITTVIIFN